MTSLSSSVILLNIKFKAFSTRGYTEFLALFCNSFNPSRYIYIYPIISELLFIISIFYTSGHRIFKHFPFSGPVQSFDTPFCTYTVLLPKLANIMRIFPDLFLLTPDSKLKLHLHPFGVSYLLELLAIKFHFPSPVESLLAMREIVVLEDNLYCLLSWYWIQH